MALSLKGNSDTLSSRGQSRVVSPENPSLQPKGLVSSLGEWLGGTIPRAQAAPRSCPPSWAPHALQALKLWIALAWQSAFCLFWVWPLLLSLSFQGYRLIHQVLCFHGLMITVCEKQTNKQTLRLLGSIGSKKGPCANNKLERNLLFVWSATIPSTGRF